MFEFHGWAVVRLEEKDHETIAEFRQIGGREDQAVKRVRAAVNDVHDEFSLFDVRRTGNGQIVLMAHGLRNHRYEPVIDLFRWLAEELPDSYGLLYVHDDERQGQDNQFRVWRLALGEFTEKDDPFLSPYIPTVERPWEETGDASLRPVPPASQTCSLVLGFAPSELLEGTLARATIRARRGMMTGDEPLAACPDSEADR